MAFISNFGVGASERVVSFGWITSRLRAARRPSLPSVLGGAAAICLLVWMVGQYAAVQDRAVARLAIVAPPAPVAIDTFDPGSNLGYGDAARVVARPDRDAIVPLAPAFAVVPLFGADGVAGAMLVPQDTDPETIPATGPVVFEGTLVRDQGLRDAVRLALAGQDLALGQGPVLSIVPRSPDLAAPEDGRHAPWLWTGIILAALAVFSAHLRDSGLIGALRVRFKRPPELPEG
ncbi:hypothetical protein E2L08_04195 [Palleronia sediminis]|uniref:Uncharacterized protein n=1 Tax=Palleronia sediminis TaxID=2547833 RepID=A0A4R6AFI7_9RHOB|nr:hypothetical protein [Palleronia sediminis]TDL81862.1 hypothetical protein E2L08_04195 [Palleronia sediminis]